MLINQTKRIYMNEADSSPGNGAPADPPNPATPPASPAAAPIDVDALVTRLVGAVDERFTTLSNGLFANARKAGLLGKEKPVEHPTPAPQPQQAPGAPTPAIATGISMADVELMLEQERVLTRAATEHKLTDAQVKRMKNALKADKPEDVPAWTSTFLADMGLAKSPQPAAPQQAVATPPAPARANVSDRGTAAPTDTRDHNGILHSRPLEMTGHDVDALMLQHGPDKGLQEFQAHVLRALGNVRIKPPRG